MVFFAEICRYYALPLVVYSVARRTQFYTCWFLVNPIEIHTTEEPAQASDFTH
jgi:hypothetical protein